MPSTTAAFALSAIGSAFCSSVASCSDSVLLSFAFLSFLDSFASFATPRASLAPLDSRISLSGVRARARSAEEAEAAAEATPEATPEAKPDEAAAAAAKELRRAGGALRSAARSAARCSLSMASMSAHRRFAFAWCQSRWSRCAAKKSTMGWLVTFSLQKVINESSSHVACFPLFSFNWGYI